MVRVLPSVLRPPLLPEAVLSAARLNGELWALHDGYIPVDEPDRPELRLGALSLSLHHRDLVTGRTAAWVYGWCTRAAVPLEIVGDSRRARNWRGSIRYRNLRIPQEDLRRFPGVSIMVTSRERAVCDIARDHPRAEDAMAAVTLARGSQEFIDTCMGRLGPVHSGSRSQARAFLDVVSRACADYPPFTR